MYWFALLPPLWKTRNTHINWMTIGTSLHSPFSGLASIRIGDVHMSLRGLNDGGGRGNYSQVDLKIVRDNRMPSYLEEQLMQGSLYVKTLTVVCPTAIGGEAELRVEGISVEATDSAYNPVATRYKEEGEEDKAKRKGKKKKRGKKRKGLFSRRDKEKEDDFTGIQMRREVIYKKVWVEKISLTLRDQAGRGKESGVFGLEGMTTRLRIERNWTIQSDSPSVVLLKAETDINKVRICVAGWAVPHLEDLRSVVFGALAEMYFPPGSDLIWALKAVFSTDQTEVILMSDVTAKEVTFECTGSSEHEKVFHGSLRDGKQCNIEIGQFPTGSSSGSADKDKHATLTIQSLNFTLKDFCLHQEIKL